MTVATSTSVLNPSSEAPLILLILLVKKPLQRADHLLHDVLAFCLLADATGSLFSIG